MTRTMHEIQSDAMKLIEVRMKSSVEACDWVAVHDCAVQLADIAQRGLHHIAMSRQGDIAQLAMRNFQPEADPR